MGCDRLLDWVYIRHGFTYELIFLIGCGPRGQTVASNALGPKLAAAACSTHSKRFLENKMMDADVHDRGQMVCETSVTLTGNQHNVKLTLLDIKDIEAEAGMPLHTMQKKQESHELITEHVLMILRFALVAGGMSHDDVSNLQKVAEWREMHFAADTILRKATGSEADMPHAT